MAQCATSFWDYLKSHPELLTIVKIPSLARRWEFLTPTNIWVANHQFNRRPNFLVTDRSGVNYQIAPQKIDDSIIIIEWEEPIAGYLYLN